MEARNVLAGIARRLRNLPGSIADGVRRATARPHDAPVIVLGNQKSGTTAIAALLAELAGTSCTQDVFFRFRRPVLAELLQEPRRLDAFVKQNPFWFSTEIIKEPSLTFFHAELKAIFPAARFVMIVRDPRDNIRSILNRLQIPGDLPQIDEQHVARFPAGRGWRLILDGHAFETAGDTYIETLARRWNRAAEIARRHRAEFALVRYEDFRSRKEQTIKDLAARVGLPDRFPLGEKVDTQYQPKGRSDVLWTEFFGESNLLTIERTCRDLMDEFGYAVTMAGDGSESA